ncbi:MAG: tRNA-dihydrouridine synthase, partial [Pseudomonadota bacterium]
KNSISIPVIGNGDIRCFEDGLKMMVQTGCDGVMIGRGAMGQPWIFQELVQGPRGGRSLSVHERWAVMLEHVLMMHDFYGEDTGVRIARKHLAWYSGGLPGSAEFRATINRLDDPAAVKSALVEVFRPAIDRAAA